MFTEVSCIKGSIQEGTRAFYITIQTTFNTNLCRMQEEEGILGGEYNIKLKYNMHAHGEKYQDFIMAEKR